MYIKNGNIEIENFMDIGDAPLPAIPKTDICRPLNLTLPPNPVNITTGDQRFLPVISNLGTNDLAFPTEIVGTKARISFVGGGLELTLTTELISNYTNDIYSNDGHIFKDEHDGRFYNVAWNTVTSTFDVHQVNYIDTNPIIFYSGVVIIDTPSGNRNWLRLVDRRIVITRASDHNL
jgi:hypothetical protein